MTTPDFFTFLKNISNPSLVVLEDNPKYDDLLGAVADMFTNIYEKMEHLKITTAYDMTYETVDLNILSFISHYLDTDHLKDTLFVLMRLWQEKHAPFVCEGEHDYVTLDGEYVLLHGERIWIGSLIDDFINDPEGFIKREVLKSFIFFIKNSGSLHKSKGIKPLLDRLIEFYGPPNCIDGSFTGVFEHDKKDVYDHRMINMTSVRSVVEKSSILAKYPEYSDDFSTTTYLELHRYKYCLANGRVFVSLKSREDWYEFETADNIYKLGDFRLVIHRDNRLYVYSEDFDIYDMTNNSFQFIQPVPVKIIGLEDNLFVRFVPDIANKSTDTELYENKLYFVKLDMSTLEYSLDVIEYDDKLMTTKVFSVISSLRINEDPAFFAGGLEPRKVIENINSIWIGKDNKVVYLFTMEYLRYIFDEETESYSLIRENFICLAEDGNTENEEFYKILDKIPIGQNLKIQMIERVYNEPFVNSVGKYTPNVSAVLDILYPKSDFILHANQEEIGFSFSNSISIRHKLFVIGDTRKLYNLPKIYLDVDTIDDIIYMKGNAQEHFDDYPKVVIGYRKGNTTFLTYLFMDQYSVKMSKFNLNRIIRGYPTKDSTFGISSVRLSDKHIYVNCSINTNDFHCVVIENMDYLLSREFRSKIMGLSYNPNINKITRQSQFFFNKVDRLNYRDVDNRRIESIRIANDVRAEKNEEFIMSNLISRYKPINVVNRGLFPTYDLGRSDQLGSFENQVDKISYSFEDDLKIIVKIKISDEVSYSYDDGLYGEKTFMDVTGFDPNDTSVPDYCEESSFGEKTFEEGDTIQ